MKGGRIMLHMNRRIRNRIVDYFVGFTQSVSNTISELCFWEMLFMGSVLFMWLTKSQKRGRSLCCCGLFMSMKKYFIGFVRGTKIKDRKIGNRDICWSFFAGNGTLWNGHGTNGIGFVWYGGKGDLWRGVRKKECWPIWQNGGICI